MAAPTPVAGRVKRDRTHYLYIAVIVAVLAGVAVGFAAPDAAVELKPIGEGTSSPAPATRSGPARPFAKAGRIHEFA